MIEFDRQYFADATMRSTTGETDAKTDALEQIFNELNTLTQFDILGETDSKRLGKLDAKANRLRKELLEVLEELQGSNTLELEHALKATIQTKRAGEINTILTEQYTQKLLAAGFTKDDLNRYYLPAIKRFIKNPKIDPFLIN